MGVPTTLGRFAVKEQSAWGTAQTSFANANFLEAQVTIPTPAQGSIQAEVMRAGWFATERVAGGRGPSEISLTMPLHGFSTATPSGEATEHPDALLLRSVLGGSNQDGYSTDLGGGTASTIVVTTGDATVVGQAVLVPLAATSPTEYSVGWIKSKASNTYTVQRDFALTAAGGPQTPDSTGSVYGSSTVFLSNTQPTPFTLEWLGATGNVAFRFIDCVVTSASITLNSREQPTLAVTIRAGDWANDGTGGAPSAAALADRPQLPVVLSDNGARVVDANAEQKAGTVAINLSMDVADETNYDAPQGISRFVTTKRSVEVQIVAPAAATSASSLDDPASLTAPGASVGALQIEACTTPGRAFSALVSSGVVRELQALGDANSLVSVTSTLECAIYSDDSTDSGSMGSAADTSFRLAFL